MPRLSYMSPINPVRFVTHQSGPYTLGTLSRSAGEGVSRISQSPSPALRERGDPARRTGWVRVGARVLCLVTTTSISARDNRDLPEATKRRILRCLIRGGEWR